VEWEKKGLIYCSSGENGWRNNSFLNPAPFLLNEDVIRFYGSFRDESGVGRIGYVDVDSSNPKQIIAVSNEPVLDIGRRGMFDDTGVVPTCILENNNKIYLYYAGYNLGKNVRFLVFTGMAVSFDRGNSFERIQETPVTDRVAGEEFFRVIHSIFYDDNKFKLWYGGGNQFINGKEKTLPVYDIRYSESNSELAFAQKGRTVLSSYGDCHRVGRPYVFKEEEKYKMYYGYGGEDYPYQLAYAESEDGIDWDKKDINLGLSNKGWDSEMMAYPAFVRCKGKGYLFYNGNNYGYDGFGYAELKEH
jgi:hypothetical protein